ncbi:MULTISPECIES: DUF1631 family protein [unclassified Acidovorax]|uniref:DUF1631 family protein n=1 Tax=unclassified Acidovorax TaxID=2684926 RepID=UPI000708D852|nr:DUF1631 family protein [Acidovorax sp. Root217]KRC15013.1 hypothetical protein ASE31_08490 [Acidovorax sp. Root217]
MALKHSAPPDPASFGGNAPHYQRIVDGVLADSRQLMERVAEATRMSLQLRQDQARTPGEHQGMLEAQQQLMRLTSVMGERYPGALRKALEQQTTAPGEEKPSRSLFTIHFDQLELMDESQITESVERARARQVLASAVEGPLADLDALVCAAQGLPRVQPEHNPLRPEVFLQALQAVVSQMQATAQVRNDWMAHMAKALGTELKGLYLAQIDLLKQGGVRPVGYAMRQADGEYVYVAPGNGAAAPGFGDETDMSVPAGSGDPLLTLDRLRRLLLGEFSEQPVPQQSPAAAPDDEPFAERFAREFDSPVQLPQIDPPATDFAMTVPAAFEALQEMNQVGQMMERLGSQRAQPGDGPGQRRAAGLGDALGMEVVALMVDNIARDSRLLWPVQQFVRALEPALMQLALADPRFFSNKEHPARRLLQDITDHSMAFNGAEAPGFKRFMRSLMDIAGPLASATIEGADDFEQVRQQLHAQWADGEQVREQERLRAIEALEHAEQRHLLAARLSGEIRLLPQIDNIPGEIAHFLLGPWAQVMAQARLTDRTGSADPGRYQELVGALVWSAQPELTRTNTGELARLIPQLLPRLREGLALIDYPADRTEAVFAQLMQLHQQAFHGGPKPAGQPAPTLLTQEDEEPWLAPSEAQDSGFMDDLQPSQPGTLEPPPEPTPVDGPTRPALAVGSWVNLLVAGQWERTQLSWVGSQGTFFLFTNASGRTQSMTLRLLDRCIQQGSLQVLSQQPVVDVALDAVAQAAMRNSVESRL